MKFYQSVVRTLRAASEPEALARTAEGWHLARTRLHAMTLALSAARSAAYAR